MAAGRDAQGRGSRGNRAERRVFWREHVEAQVRSELSIRGYCLEHGLTQGSFYRWLRRFRLEEEAAARPADGRAVFARVQVTAPSPSGSPLASSESVEVVLQNGRALRVRPGFDAETLQRTVTALEALPC